MSETKEKDRKRDSSDTDREGQFRRRARASTCGEGGAQAGGTSAAGRAQVDELTPRNMTTSVLPLLFLRISSQPFFVMMAVTRGFTSWTSLRVLVLLSRRTAMTPQRPSPSPSPLHAHAHAHAHSATASRGREPSGFSKVVKASPLEIGSEPCEVRHLSFLIRRIFGVQLLDTDLTHCFPPPPPPPQAGPPRPDFYLGGAEKNRATGARERGQAQEKLAKRVDAEGKLRHTMGKHFVPSCARVRGGGLEGGDEERADGNARTVSPFSRSARPGTTPHHHHGRA